MSLRAFHIVFVMVCVALSAFVALWGFRQGSPVLGFVFLTSAIVLVEYGRRVYRKLREIP